MTKKIALLSLVAAALVAVPAGLAAGRETPKPGTPAALAAKLKLKTLAAQKFTHLYVLHCHASTTTNPSGPIVAKPFCTKAANAIVGELKKLDQAIEAKLAAARSGSKAETLLQRLDARLQTVLSNLQATVGAPSVTIVPISPGTGGNA